MITLEQYVQKLQALMDESPSNAHLPVKVESDCDIGTVAVAPVDGHTLEDGYLAWYGSSDAQEEAEAAYDEPMPANCIILR